MDLLWSFIQAFYILFWFLAAGSLGLTFMFFKPARRMLERLLKGNIDFF